MTLRLSCIVAVVLLPTLALVAFDQPQDAEEVIEEVSADDVLRGQMEVIEEGLKKLRRSLRDPEQNEASLATIVEIEAAALICKGEIPPRVESVPEAERPAFLTGYRKEMAQVLTRMLALEVAVLDGEQDLARELWRGIHDMEDPGHETYSEEE